MIESVIESLKLLHIVAQYPNRGLSELSRVSELNKSRTFRMLTTLASQNFITQNDDGSYQLGYQLLILGQYARNQTNLIQAVETESESLQKLFNENLQLRILEGNAVVQIWRKSSSQSLQVRSEAGNRRKLGAGASGKVLLAFTSSKIQEQYLKSLPYEQSQQIQQILTEILNNGFYLSKSELTQGVYAIAFPIFNAKKQCIASFSMSIPQIRATPKYLEEITVLMQKVSQRISTLLGFIPPL